MKKLLFHAGLLLIASAPVFAQKTAITLQTGSPASVGMSEERLGRIDKVLQEYADKRWVNGVTAMIVKDGKIVYNKAFGYDNVARKTPMKTDEIFRIASQTKAITSVAVMMLYEEGKFLLDDPISKYIPAFKHPKVITQFNMLDTTYTTAPAKREITIRHLLTHTSGIDYAQIGSKEANAMYAKAGVIGGIGVGKILLADKMKILGGLPIFHEPGEKFTYGLNTDVLGYLVEVLSGMSLDQFLRQRLFEPLGMKDTYFYLPKEKQSRLASLYSEDKNSGTVELMPAMRDLNGNFVRDYPNEAGTYYSGGGGLSSTMYDYAIFLQMLLNGGEYNGQRILGRNTVRIMTMNQIGDVAYDEVGNKFGLGFKVTTPEGSSFSPLPEGVFEWGGMFATTYWADPKERVIGLIYRNIWPTSRGELPLKYKVLVYQALNR
ncbi:beta-lactamase family protein [Chitinophaga pendula]|uniref:serine hydrolase domain-containing protein n=1 Tax=Chitinophaga TaxID=79328 RepID=UPI000BAF5A4B|nr:MULTISPECIES: serine hydrolase domain-containing protein [Chitinophaga]ASZ14863.1 serine hydrolase [Chitinophaga sp. MD30]UCJ05987.1 beta-lactamase family protein [Chitinophaga pendula]